MLITEFARRAGVSARSLRHYEEQGLLSPHRTPSGYRLYDEGDLVAVERIRLMLEAGLSTAVIAEYLDCVRAGEGVLEVEMCPNLRRELERVEQRLDRQQEQIAETRRALCALG